GLPAHVVRTRCAERAPAVPRARPRLRARGRPPHRARARSTLRPADDALRPRLPEGTAARAVLVPQAPPRVQAGRACRPLRSPLRPRHVDEVEVVRARAGTS